MMERGPDKSKSQQAQSLLAQQSVRGWWPCAIEKDGKKELGVSTEEAVVWLFTVHDGKIKDWWLIVTQTGLVEVCYDGLHNLT